ncbi:MAG TPA: hypothetical protein VN426_15525 [Syntrophomonadaceae bacterium]|nr:hypothetical protein [Syntrophomonadaceae bacterium]
MLVALIILSLPSLAQADAEWKIKLNGDRSVKEIVTLDKAGLQSEYPTWKASQAGDKLVLTRSVSNAQTFNQETDRLPLELKVKDYGLWQNIEVHSLSTPVSAGVAAAFMNQVQGMRLIIQTSGPIGENSADSLADGSTATWQLKSPSSIYNEGILMKATVVDGFMMGIALFLLAFIIIAILFIRKINKTHKLIEEEYSLENLQPNAPDDQEENEEDK